VSVSNSLPVRYEFFALLIISNRLSTAIKARYRVAAECVGENWRENTTDEEPSFVELKK
jgi:hypothetical protein